MPLKFKSVTEIEFNDMESLEKFARDSLPFEPHQIVDFFETKKLVDNNDQVEATGSGTVTHTFTIEGEE